MRVFSVLGFLFIYFFGFSQAKDLELAEHYFQEGSYTKALLIYTRLANLASNINTIHDNYFKALKQEKAYKTCKNYFKKILKWFPDNPKYNIDYGVYLTVIDKEDQAHQHYDRYLDRISHNRILLNPVGQYFMQYKYYDYAYKTYRLGLKIDPVIFGLELAALHRIQGKITEALRVYLNILEIAPDEINSIQNSLLNYIHSTDEKTLEKMIFEYINKTNRIVFNELLAWFYIQKKDFYKAFIQARSIDKRRRLGGKKLMELAKITLDSKDYDLSAEILNYVIKHYAQVLQIYYAAYKQLINVQELRIKNTFPINLDKMQEIVDSYKEIINQKIQYQGQYSVAEEKISLAKLYAFHLDKKDLALELLKEVIKIPVPKYQPTAMLTLADIYVLTNQSWEANLLYLKVQKRYKGSEAANLAKFKSAKVQYFEGNFKLAKDYLDIIKSATTRKTANDAIELSMFIDDNSSLDTTDILLRRFASIELLAYQNKYEEVLATFETLLVDCKNHPLVDDILWRQAKIMRKLGHFENAIKKLKIIVENYGGEILGDDANFTIGLIYEENLKRIDEAKKFYKKHLIDFKDSWYATEARQRYRKLNGL